MTVNRIQIKASLSDDRVVIPIGQTFDEAGREQLIETYEQTELQDNINEIIDYETTSYSHTGILPVLNPLTHDYNTYYEFWFFNSGGTYSAPATYEPQSFSNSDLSKQIKGFTNSFYKFDYYDSPYRKQQKLMFSIIVTANQSKKVNKPIPNNEYEYVVQIAQGVITPNWDIYVPEMSLGPINDGENLYSEGYFIQWLKNRQNVQTDTFYMSCKFFNAKTGKIVRMLNRNPIDPNTGMPYTVYEYPDWFYYEVKLKINNTSTENPKFGYTIRECNSLTLSTGIPGQQAGTLGNPINFFEYVNP